MESSLVLDSHKASRRFTSLASTTSAILADLLTETSEPFCDAKLTTEEVDEENWDEEPAKSPLATLIVFITKSVLALLLVAFDMVSAISPGSCCFRFNKRLFSAIEDPLAMLLRDDELNDLAKGGLLF
jgi:hypothetical protein